MDIGVGEHGGATTVCVTGASGFIGSWLVMRLLQSGYHVRATVRDLHNEKKVKHLVDLPNASTHLSLWKGDLTEEGSFDDAIQGCQGVFHVATPMDKIIDAKDPEVFDMRHLHTPYVKLWDKDADEGGKGTFDGSSIVMIFEEFRRICNEGSDTILRSIYIFWHVQNEVIKPTVNGTLNIMRSCSKAKTVRKFVYTSTIGTIIAQPQPPPKEYDESFWTDADFCRAQNIPMWTYIVAKTMAEKAAWKYAEENSLDMVSIHPSTVIGPFLTPSRPSSVEVAIVLYTRNEALYPMLSGLTQAVHVEDVCNAHIYLFEHPQAQGRYICSSHIFTIFDLAKSLSLKYPEDNMPIEFKGIDKSMKVIPCSSKKLTDLGFKFSYNPVKYAVGDLFSEAIESCRGKGLLPI